MIHEHLDKNDSPLILPKSNFGRECMQSSKKDEAKLNSKSNLEKAYAVQAICYFTERF